MWQVVVAVVVSCLLSSVAPFPELLSTSAGVFSVAQCLTTATFPVCVCVRQRERETLFILQKRK